MANTVHGPYAPTTWTSGVTPLSATNENNQETQARIALAGFNPDLIGSGFVLSGVTCAKDGSIANQLDVASGEAYLIMTDGTLARCDVATTTFVTSVASTTYYLDLNPDGTWSWGTSHSGVTNRMFIAQATTDGSGNILVVTDNRTLYPTLLANAAGLRIGPLVASVNGQNTAGSFGVPVIVAQTLHAGPSGTGANTILSFTIPASGLYRVSCAFRAGTSGNITLKATYTDSFASVARTSYFQANQDSITSYVTLAAAAITNAAFTVAPMTLDCLNATTLAVVYQNSAGAGSDLVSALVERLA